MSDLPRCVWIVDASTFVPRKSIEISGGHTGIRLMAKGMLTNKMNCRSVARVEDQYEEDE